MGSSSKGLWYTESMKKFLFEDLSLEECRELCGIHDANLRYAEKAYQTSLSFQDNCLIVNDSKDEISDLVHDVFEKALERLRSHQNLENRDFRYICDHILDLKAKDTTRMMREVGKTYHNRMIYPKTLGQAELVEKMRNYDILFAIGPAGTGKTYLAVVYACHLLKENRIKKIILTRPAVEAGENLGFLPGDLKEKVDPYLAPLYDALYDCLGQENVERLMERNTIEIAPLAYMRGRTLDEAFIILDEAQNTTISQMKMFLTRLGNSSKMIINGDISQVDLKGVKSGLIDAAEVLKDIPEIGFVTLTSKDVVRHPLVQKIIDAYEVKNEH